MTISQRAPLLTGQQIQVQQQAAAHHSKGLMHWTAVMQPTCMHLIASSSVKSAITLNNVMTTVSGLLMSPLCSITRQQSGQVSATLLLRSRYKVHQCCNLCRVKRLGSSTVSSWHGICSHSPVCLTHDHCRAFWQSTPGTLHSRHHQWYLQRQLM